MSTTDTTVRAAPSGRALPPNPNLDWLRKEAKRRLPALRAMVPGARLFLAQLAVARDYGFASWRALVSHVRALNRALPNPWADALAVATADATRRGDLDAIERYLRAALEAHPDDDDLIAQMAWFQAEAREANEEAEPLFRRLRERGRANGLAHCAWWAERTGTADPDGVETLLREAAGVPDEPYRVGFALNHLAGFLAERRGDIDAAADAYRQAAALRSGYARVDAVHIGNHAEVLWHRGDTQAAEAEFRRARALSPDDGRNAILFASLLTATGRVREGLSIAAEIRDLPLYLGLVDPTGLDLAVRFLNFAHDPRPDADTAWRDLLGHLASAEGHWRHLIDLRPNAATAIAAGHPMPNVLRLVGDLLSTPGTLAESEIDTISRAAGGG